MATGQIKIKVHLKPGVNEATNLVELLTLLGIEKVSRAVGSPPSSIVAMIPEDANTFVKLIKNPCVASVDFDA